jgi:indolepyruvate ferredoxin oxidoreductase beta subunit
VENTVTNILLAGVGGQGIILASDVMAEVFLEAGFDSKKSEIHGMAQRGGSVTSHVRFGTKIYSPVIKPGETDILLAFEQLEAMRWVHYVKTDGIVIMNDCIINPPAVNLGQMAYPRAINATIQKHVKHLEFVSGTRIAQEVGDIRAANVVLLGALSRQLDIAEAIWIDTILKHLPQKIHALNRKAFAAGRA